MQKFPQQVTRCRSVCGRNSPNCGTGHYWQWQVAKSSSESTPNTLPPDEHRKSNFVACSSKIAEAQGFWRKGPVRKPRVLQRQDDEGHAAALGTFSNEKGEVRCPAETDKARTVPVSPDPIGPEKDIPSQNRQSKIRGGSQYLCCSPCLDMHIINLRPQAPPSRGPFAWTDGVLCFPRVQIRVRVPVKKLITPPTSSS
jgi:hypothetical protein